MIDIFLINLKSRPDRLRECEENFIKFGIDFTKVKVIEAICNPKNGALGCAKSHVHSLSEFLTRHDNKYAIILEDDFNFKRQISDVLNDINILINNQIDFDVVLLGATYPIVQNEVVPQFKRVIESQSACGYFIKREYVPALLSCFSKSICLLEKFEASKLLMYPRVAIDIYWKRLQLNDKWYLLSNAAGMQRESYSDIEKRIVNYSEISAK